MHRTRFTRLINILLLALASAAEWIITAMGGPGLAKRAARFAIRIVRSAPATMSPPDVVASPGDTSTAEQRMWLVPGKSYEAAQQVITHPTIQPGWRMCPST